MQSATNSLGPLLLRDINTTLSATCDLFRIRVVLNSKEYSKQLVYFSLTVPISKTHGRGGFRILKVGQIIDLGR